MKPGSKVVLITGVSSGIGWATAQILAAAGHRVFGTARQPDKAGPPEGATLLAMDVREDESVRSAVTLVLEQAGRIDALVNNAGVTMFGAVEEIQIDEAKALFETNFFGVLRTVSAVLPSMRERGSGHIVNVGSIAGFLPTSFESMYGASKHALKGYSESLHYEVAPLGVAVSLIQPGFMRTAIDRNYTRARTKLKVYDAVREQVIEASNASVAKGAEPEVVGRIIQRAIESRRPKLRYLAGWDALGTRVARTLAPPMLFAMGVRAELKVRRAKQ